MTDISTSITGYRPDRCRSRPAGYERLPVREIDKVIDRANVHDAAPDHSRPGIADCALSL
jgi:hypothetical protein